MSQIQFNKRELSFNPKPSVSTKPVQMRGEIVLNYGVQGSNFVFKGEGGILFTNYAGHFSYQDGHFADRPRFLEALKKLGIVTEAEIQEYKKSHVAWRLNRAKRYFAQQLEEAAKDAKFKLTKAQQKLIDSYKN